MGKGNVPCTDTRQAASFIVWAYASYAPSLVLATPHVSSDCLGASVQPRRRKIGSNQTTPMQSSRSITGGRDRIFVHRPTQNQDMQYGAPIGESAPISSHHPSQRFHHVSFPSQAPQWLQIAQNSLPIRADRLSLCRTTSELPHFTPR